MSSEDSGDRSKSEKSHLTRNVSRCKSRRRLDLAAGALLRVGDGAEMYGIAVLMNPVFSNLASTSLEIWVLYFGMYFTLAAFIMIFLPVAPLINNRIIIMLSIYTLLITAAVSVAMPTYATLLTYRIAAGIALALHATLPHSLPVTNALDCDETHRRLIVVDRVMFYLGAAWCGLAGYICMDLIGWRWLMLLLSLPFFLLSLFLYHISMLIPGNETRNPVIIDIEGGLTYRHDVIWRIVKVGFYVSCNGLVYFGAVMLVPRVIKEFNLNNDTESPEGSLHGLDYLILSAVFGGANLIGQFLTYILNGKVTVGLKLGITSLACMISYVVMVYYSERFSLLMPYFGILQLVLGASLTEALIMSSDKVFFNRTLLKVSQITFEVCSVVALIVSNVVSNSFQYLTVLKIQLAMSILTFLSSITFLVKR